MPRPIHLSRTGTGYGGSADAEVARQNADRDLTANLRATLCGAECGTHGHWQEEEVVKITDTDRQDGLKPGGYERDRLCTACEIAARNIGAFPWITGRPLASEAPEVREIFEVHIARKEPLKTPPASLALREPPTPPVTKGTTYCGKTGRAVFDSVEEGRKAGIGDGDFCAICAGFDTIGYPTRTWTEFSPRLVRA